MNPKFKVFSDEFTKNPYPAYKNLRETESVLKMRFPDGQESWLITRYEDAVEVLKDHRFIKNVSKLFGGSMEHQSVFMNNMLFSDPPDHKRLRGLVQKSFTPQMISGMRGRIQEITNELLEEAADKETMNLIDDFAFPLPIIVICEILGVPAKDRHKFRVWSNSLIEGSNGEHAAEMFQHMNEFVQYLSEWFGKVRQNPGEDLISQLIMAENEGDHLTERELFGVVTLLIIAGHETTVNLIGNTILALLEHPEQLVLLQNHPQLIHNVIEESPASTGQLNSAHPAGRVRIWISKVQLSGEGI